VTVVQFDRFIDIELAGLGRFAAALTGNRQDAHDLVSEILVAAATRWDSIGPMVSPLAYVRRMLVNKHISQRRSPAGRMVALSGDIETFDQVEPDSADAVGLRDQTDRLLDQLPPRQRAAVVMRYYLDVDDLEIAAALKITESSVRSAIARALQHLRIVTTTETTVENCHE